MNYIHYGSNKFDIKIFKKIKNRPKFVKPEGGLWASRLETEHGWKNWCITNGYENELKDYFIFSLNNDAKILTINNCEQLKDLPKNCESFYNFLDFEKLSKKYDAIEVWISKDSNLYFELYGWDCDSILIMNPKIIIPK